MRMNGTRKIQYISVDTSIARVYVGCNNDNNVREYDSTDK